MALPKSCLTTASVPPSPVVKMITRNAAEWPDFLGQADLFHCSIFSHKLQVPVLWGSFWEYVETTFYRCSQCKEKKCCWIAVLLIYSWSIKGFCALWSCVQHGRRFLQLWKQLNWDRSADRDYLLIFLALWYLKKAAKPKQNTLIWHDLEAQSEENSIWKNLKKKLVNWVNFIDFMRN